MRTDFEVFIFRLTLLILVQSCGLSNQEDSQGNWIKVNEKEKIEIIERQFRGFDNAMVETGYRYQELYWAGQDENWEYAAYQLEKIKVAIENGLQRRPKRAQSAANFLNQALPEVQSSVAIKNTVIFNENFQLLTTHCNSCHAKEGVPFFTVKVPTERQSPIRK
jgi:hypothetical protein